MTTRYEVVRGDGGSIQRHPEQPADGFANASEAAMWCDTPPRDLGGEWYIRPMEGE